MRPIRFIRSTRAALAAAALALALSHPAAAQTAPPQTFSYDEIVNSGHSLFGVASTELASAVEYVFSRYGEPTAYIVGQEGSGALFGGLRYGEGDLRMKVGPSRRVFWQGPSVGFDVGADGSRIMVLVYNLARPEQVFDIYTATSGLVYVAGGLGVNFQASNAGQQPDVIQAVIRTGIGLRLGFNIGYVRYTPEPTWNPF